MSASESAIVVTGMGVVSPLGVGAAAFHDGLVAGRSGVGPIDYPWPTAYRALRAGRVPDDQMPADLPSVFRNTGRASRFAAASVREAMTEAGLFGEPGDGVGVVAGTTLGDADEFERGWLAVNPPLDDSGGPANSEEATPGPDWMRIGNLAERLTEAYGLRGPTHLVTTTCAAGNHAIAWSTQILAAGRAEAMVAVAADTIGYADMLGFTRLLLQAPERCQPFDRHRKGTILSEGGAALVLERDDTARRRGANILGIVAGHGSSCDAAGPFASRLSDLTGMNVAFTRALRRAGVDAAAIDHVSAHGSATRLNDHKETRFLKHVLGHRARSVPVSGIKGALGHAQGAASMLEAVACLLSFRHGVIYPTINYETADPDCDLDYVPNEARENQPNLILSNAFGVGGNNTLVLFRRWSDRS